MGVDSNKLEYGPSTNYGGLHSFLGFGLGGQSYSNFLASTVYTVFRNRKLLNPLHLALAE